MSGTAIAKAALWWYKVRPIRTINAARKLRKQIKETPMTFPQGALTYTALAGVISPFVARFLGLDVAENEWVALFQFVAAVVAVYGRKRAKP